MKYSMQGLREPKSVNPDTHSLKNIFELGLGWCYSVVRSFGERVIGSILSKDMYLDCRFYP